MVDKIGIEYVDTGNNGRSPLAETVARNNLKQFYSHLSDIIIISSSGTNSNAFIEPITSFEFAKIFVEKGDKYNIVIPGLYSFDELELVEEIFQENASNRYETDENFRNRTNTLAVKTRDHFLREETEHRNGFLKSFRLEYKGKSNKQTEINPNVGLILPMDTTNAEKVRGLYNNHNLFPRIKVLSDYAETDPLSGAYFGSPHKEEHMKAFRLIKEAAEKSIDRFVEEYKNGSISFS
nr:hypothetical protein [Candidatus Woesearchaeota archaeon]